MKRLYIIKTAAVLLAVFLLATCVAIAEDVLGKREENKEGKLSIQPPSGWSLQQTKGRGLLLYFAPPQRPNVFSPSMCVVENRGDFLPPVDKQDEQRFFDDIKSKYTEEMKTLKVESHEYTTIDGVRFLKLFMKQEMDQLKLNMLYAIAFIGRERQLQFAYTCKQDQWGKMLPVFQQSLASYKNLDKDALERMNKPVLASRDKFEGYFSLRPPLGWKKYDPGKYTDSRNIKGFYRGPVKNSFAPVLSVTVLGAPNSQPASHKKAFALLQEKLKKNIDELNYEWENENRKYDEKDKTYHMWIEIKAVKTEQTSGELLKLKHYHYVMLGHKKYYLLSFSCLESQFQEMKPLFDKVIASFVRLDS